MNGYVSDGTYFIAGQKDEAVITEALNEWSIDITPPLIDGWDFEVEVLDPHSVQDVISRLITVADKVETSDEALSEWDYDPNSESLEEYIRRCKTAIAS